MAPIQRRVRVSSFLVSVNHRTELPTAAHTNQSRALNATVENASCRNGTCITAACNSADNSTAPHSQGFENSPTNALRSSDRALNTVNSEKNTMVVNAI